MNSENFYIPPKGVYFRLLDHDDQHEHISRNGGGPKLNGNRPEFALGDQYFELLPGSGRREGQYAIKHKDSGELLSLHEGNLRMGPRDGDDDQ